MAEEPYLITKWRLLLKHPELSRPAVDILSIVYSYQRGNLICEKWNSWFATVSRCSDRKIVDEIKALCEAGLLVRNHVENTRQLTLTAAGWALVDGASGSEGEAADAPAEPPPSQTVTAEEPPAPKKEKKDRKRNPTAEEHCARDLPDYIPRDVWIEFINVRQAEHGPFSEVSATQLVNKIGTLRTEGHDPVKLLRRATQNCWKSVFPDDRGKETRASTDPRDSFPSDGGRMRFGGRLVL